MRTVMIPQPYPLWIRLGTDRTGALALVAGWVHHPDTVEPEDLEPVVYAEGPATDRLRVHYGPWRLIQPGSIPGE